MFLYTGTKAGCKKQIIIQEKISMKNVLLLGDSIRIGYDEFVQEALKDTAKVYYSDDNGRCTQYTLVSLMEIAALTGEPQKIDLIHWNNGHWDIAHYGKMPPPSTAKSSMPSCWKWWQTDCTSFFRTQKLFSLPQPR